MTYTKHLSIAVFIMTILSTTLNTTIAQNIDYEVLKHNHDLSLPDWGPYTKTYMGISHITDASAGTRFDLSVFPGLYRRKDNVPHAMFESGGLHAWEAAPNLDYYSYRHEIEWKDQVYTDVSYSKINDNARLVSIDCVNNTQFPQNITMHFMASMNFPYQKGVSQNQYFSIQPSSIPWIEAESYTKYKTETVLAKDNLMPDGQIKGAVLNQTFIGASAIKPESRSILNYNLNKSYSQPATIVLRYSSNKTTSITLSGVIDSMISLPATNGMELIKFDITPNAKQKELNISYNGSEILIIDGFAIVSSAEAAQIKVNKVLWEHVAEEIDGPTKRSKILKYPGIDKYYGIMWDFDTYMVRRFHYNDLGEQFKRMINHHTTSTFKSDSKMSYFNIFMRPIFLDPNSTTKITGVVCCGDSVQDVADQIKEYQKLNSTRIYNEARKSLTILDNYPEGDKYKFSQELEIANLSSNIVFPIYTQNQYIRHHTPGRWWNSLYTWDCGFVGLGFSQIDIQRAIESLNTYTNDTDEAAAFIHHGSPVPVQMYLFHEIWNSTQSKEFLEHFYPRMKRYYDFFMARVEGSSMRQLNSGLISTWDYFYNSGGWDDYPVQRAGNKLFAPVVSSSHTIRSAKILKMAALTLGLKDDIKIYDKDIELLTEALNKYSWDSKSGYFGYVSHNKSKDPIGIVKYKDGTNYNKGLDGVYPFVADVCDADQQQKVLSHLKTKGELWSDSGISTVDQSAPYYRADGYWNGAVWMPHQWFFWRAMLDAGEGDFAYKIATTALDMWKRETDRTYNCYEHFIIQTGCGAGWHQFGGLSTPVLAWYKSYFCKGSFTTGLNVWVKEKSFSPDYDNFVANLSISKKTKSEFVTVICMNPDYNYEATWCGKAVKVEKLFDGVYNIYIPYSAMSGKLVVKRAM